MDPRFSSEQRRELHDRIVPMVRQLPGFVSGHWNEDRLAARSYAYLVWQTEEAASRFAAFVRGSSASRSPFGVTLESIAAVEVVALELAA